MSELKGDFTVYVVDGAVEGIEKVTVQAGNALYEYVQQAGGQVHTFEWGTLGFNAGDAQHGASFTFTWPPGTTDGFDDGLRSAIVAKMATAGWECTVDSWAGPA